MTRRSTLSSLCPEDMDRMIELRGLITRTWPNGDFTIQEGRNGRGEMPRHIECIYNGPAPDLGKAVKVEGKVTVNANPIFASSLKATIFKWILTLLVSVLPCKDRILTLCSDDDTGLDGAFTLARESDATNEIDQRINRLKRVICFWHKSMNFANFLLTIPLHKEQRDKAHFLFQQIGFCRNRIHVDHCIRELLSLSADITCYWRRNIEPKLKYISKAYIGDSFTCGYITSSISEAANHQLKSFVQSRTLTLAEMRAAATELYEQRETNEAYIKGRKPHKQKDPRILEMIARFNVSPKIAEALVESTRKQIR